MTMTKTYLALALLITVLAGNAYGEDEVYYCADIDSNGFKINKEHGSYKPQLFEMKKFKMKLNRTANSVEVAHDEGFLFIIGSQWF